MVSTWLSNIYYSCCSCAIYRMRHVGSDPMSVEEKERILRARHDADRIYKVSDYIIVVVLSGLLE